MRRIRYCCFAGLGLVLLLGALIAGTRAPGRQAPSASAPAESLATDRPAASRPVWPRDQVPGVRRRPGADADTSKRGLILKTDGACPGYTLFAPLNSTTTYLVDLNGELVHSWPSRHEPGLAVHLLADGSLLRAAREPENRHFGGGGIGGRVERLAPDGTRLWEYAYANEQHCQHHDIRPLPNGHVLLIAWEKKTREEVLAAGADPEQMTAEELWPDCVVEVEPQGATGGTIVWEWHVWDHLVQQHDKKKPNYGVVAEHPELVDLNYARIAPRESSAEMQRLRSLGYVGGAETKGPEEEQGGGPPGGPPGGPGGMDPRADWCHTNSIDYNARLDQIVLSVHSFNEVWIIDHGTTTKEAAGHRGGRQGKGGDLLYRWGNPRAYGAGGADDQMLFAQHDACWIPEGAPGAGHVTIFNNGPGRPDGHYSSIVEIALPVSAAGSYRLQRGRAFEPVKPCWEYTAANKTDFFSSHISGAQRLSNGNTLVCSGEDGRVFEVTPAGKTVWDYANPYLERPEPRGGFGPFPGPGPEGDRPGWGRGPTSRPRPERDSVTDGGMGPASAPADRERRQQPAGPGRPPGPPGPPPWGPPGGGPGGPFGGPGGPPGGPGGPPGGPGGGLFRAVRLPADDPGVRAVLQAKTVSPTAGS